MYAFCGFGVSIIYVLCCLHVWDLIVGSLWFLVNSVVCISTIWI